jgi:DNA-directed RNA polymerase subunit N (RpoN/RPB10)
MAKVLPSICISCGTLIGHLWPTYYKMIKEKNMSLMKDAHGELKEAVLVNHDKFMSNKDILDHLGVKNICCRITLITAITTSQNVFT